MQRPECRRRRPQSSQRDGPESAGSTSRLRCLFRCGVWPSDNGGYWGGVPQYARGRWPGCREAHARWPEPWRQPWGGRGRFRQPVEGRRLDRM